MHPNEICLQAMQYADTDKTFCNFQNLSCIAQAFVSNSIKVQVINAYNGT